MSRFKIEAPDGRQITVEGDDEPTDEEVEEILSSLPEKAERMTISTPKPKQESHFEPSLMRGLMSLLKGLGKKLDETGKPAKPPIVNVEAPKVTVAAPVVNVQSPSFKELEMRCIERDEFGRAAVWKVRVTK